ncbi:MAG TPA: hypothetical protein DHW40_05010 [Microbacterium sp.]|nr:hypothetical protein [Microbacterium sp.]
MLFVAPFTAVPESRHWYVSVAVGFQVPGLAVRVLPKRTVPEIVGLGAVVNVFEVGVGVGVGVAVGFGVAVRVGVGVGFGLAVAFGVAVGMACGDAATAEVPTDIAMTSDITAMPADQPRRVVVRPTAAPPRSGREGITAHRTGYQREMERSNGTRQRV